MNKLALIVISTTLVLFSSGLVNSIYGLTPDERYASGYGHGCSDANAGGHPYLDRHPTHTKYFMNGYNAGYADCSRNENNINWLEICRNPIVDFIVKEPCGTLTTPDGFTLTSEGERVLRCIAGGGALLLIDPTGTTLASAKALGPAVGCG